MKSYANNEKVNYGLYVSARPIDICMVGEDGERIDGKAHARYTRLPTLLLVGLAPALGGLFVFAFPALVVVAICYAAFRLVVKPVNEVANEHAYVAQMRWSPIASHLQHEDGKGDEEGEPVASDEDAELTDAVQEQREKETK